MTVDETLAAILAAVQVDPGQRGLKHLFPLVPHDFANACRSIANHPAAACLIQTGFFIPSADPPAFETDGPLGALFLMRALNALGIGSRLDCEEPVRNAIRVGSGAITECSASGITHAIAIERAGPAADGRCYTMRGRDLTPFLTSRTLPGHVPTIGIGDGGNEIGMGKLPHELITANIPNGDLIHCRIATDHLIIAGVSNWGAYALAAGIFVLRGIQPPSDLFDPEREQILLQAMVEAGPLVDGVSGKPTATVDGLTWEEYTQPVLRIRTLLEART